MCASARDLYKSMKKNIVYQLAWSCLLNQNNNALFWSQSPQNMYYFTQICFQRHIPSFPSPPEIHNAQHQCIISSVSIYLFICQTIPPPSYFNDPPYFQSSHSQ